MEQKVCCCCLYDSSFLVHWWFNIFCRIFLAFTFSSHLFFTSFHWQIPCHTGRFGFDLIFSFSGKKSTGACLDWTERTEEGAATAAEAERIKSRELKVFSQIETSSAQTQLYLSAFVHVFVCIWNPSRCCFLLNLKTLKHLQNRFFWINAKWVSTADCYSSYAGSFYCTACCCMFHLSQLLWERQKIEGKGKDL